LICFHKIESDCAVNKTDHMRFYSMRMRIVNSNSEKK
jgi:hypothetical protein